MYKGHVEAKVTSDVHVQKMNKIVWAQRPSPLQILNLLDLFSLSSIRDIISSRSFFYFFKLSN